MTQPRESYSDHPYLGYSLVVDQEAIDNIARLLREWGYDNGDRPIVPDVGVSPNLRVAVASALRKASIASR